MKIKSTYIGFALLAFSSLARADQFNVAQMPEGAEVTLPGAAKTMVPVSTTIKVGSTDMPQTISIVPVMSPGARAVPVTLSIYDAKQDRVKYVQIAPGSPFLYSFKGLSTITLHTDLPKSVKNAKSDLQLKIESDKPLTVAR